MISNVKPETIQSIWGQVQPMIERALKHAQGDTTSTDDIYEDIVSGDMKLWVVHDNMDVNAVIGFEIKQYPKLRVMFINFISGKNMAEWIDDAEKLLFDYRDLTGCDAIQSSSRPGMVKKLVERGWKKKATIMEAPHV